MIALLYRASLHLLPAQLRQKHGGSMEALFVREIELARTRGRYHAALAGTIGIADVLRRGTYEVTRSLFTVSRMSQRGTPMISSNTHTPSHGASSMHNPHQQLPRTRELLARHAISFAVAFTVLTSALLLVFGSRQSLFSGGATLGAAAELLLLALPFTAAMTIPMAAFVSVMYEFSRLGKNGTLAAAQSQRDGVRRVVLPVIVAAACISALSFVVTAEVVPRTNAKLAVVLNGGAPVERSDRTMTITELRLAALNASISAAPEAAARAVAYEVEVQKKFALPAACLVLSLAAMALAFRVPRGGLALTGIASLVFFGAYYASMMTGETLADRLLVSPFVGMWWGNAFIATAALVAMWRRDRRPPLTTPVPR